MRQPAVPVKHARAAGSGTSTIGVLEVVNPSLHEPREGGVCGGHGSRACEKMTQAAKVMEATKTQDLRYKIRESAPIDWRLQSYIRIA